MTPGLAAARQYTAARERLYRAELTYLRRGDFQAVSLLMDLTNRLHHAARAESEAWVPMTPDELRASRRRVG